MAVQEPQYEIHHEEVDEPEGDTHHMLKPKCIVHHLYQQQGHRNCQLNQVVSYFEGRTRLATLPFEEQVIRVGYHKEYYDCPARWVIKAGHAFSSKYSLANPEGPGA